jgi:hypothetical protein
MGAGQPLDHARVFQVAQTRREQRPRDARQAALDLVEAKTPPSGEAASRGRNRKYLVDFHGSF